MANLSAMSADRIYVGTVVRGREAPEFWFSVGGNEAGITDKTPEKLFRMRFCRGRQVYVLGTADNAKAVLAAYDAAKSGDVSAVYVGSPSVCLCEDEAANPNRVAQRMRGLYRPSSVGGWHRLTVSEVPQYRLAACACKLVSGDYDHGINAAIDAALRAHPAWAAVSFAQRPNPRDLAMVLGSVVDPRWFCDPYRPDSKDLLNSYFSLSPRYVSRRMSRGDLSGPSREDAILRLSLEFAQVISGQDADATEKEGACEAVMRSAIAIKYLHFVSDLWLDELSNARLFDPKEYFHKDSSMERFRRYRNRVKATRLGLVDTL